MNIIHNYNIADKVTVNNTKLAWNDLKGCNYLSALNTIIYCLEYPKFN